MNDEFTLSALHLTANDVCILVMLLKANQFHLGFLSDIEPWLQLHLMDSCEYYTTTILHVHPSTLWWSMTRLRQPQSLHIGTWNLVNVWLERMGGKMPFVSLNMGLIMPGKVVSLTCMI